MMQALIFHGTKQLAVEQVPEPRIAAHEALIKVSACGICGSDLHGYLGHSPRRSASVPLIMGHEFTGQIAEFGSEVGLEVRQKFAVGDRVVIQPQISCGRCRACQSGYYNVCPNMKLLGIERAGGFAEYVAVPADRLFALPANLSEAEGSLTETLAVEVHLFRTMAAPLLRTVVILGAGAQGLLAVQLARLAGASQIVVADLVPQRLALAGQMGATRTVQADSEDVVKTVLALTDNWGADFVLEAVGVPLLRQQALAMIAPHGTIGLIGLGKGETTLNVLPIVNKEITIRGSYCYTDDDFQRSIELISSGQIKVQSMLYEAPLGEGIPYFERLIEEPAHLTKVLLRPEQR